MPPSDVKLWRVEVTKVVYVLAATREHAERDAEGYANEEYDADVFGHEIETLREVETEWRDSLPYGGADDRTIEQWFAAKGQP